MPTRVVARALLMGLLAGALGWSAGDARADPGVATVDLNADARSLVAQLTAERAITLANARGQADAAQDELYKQLNDKDRALRAAQAKAAGNAAALAQARKDRDEIARQREELIAALTRQDQTLAEEVRAYREEITKIASSPDPQKQKALQRFADGEQAEALADLDMIADAKRAAHQKAVDMADAAERRPTAWLAVQAHDQGHETLDRGTGRFEQLTRLDPRMTWEWIELGRLYEGQGRLADAKNAAALGRWTASVLAGISRGSPCRRGAHAAGRMLSRSYPDVRAERDIPYPMTVIRMSGWPTEQEARDDALARGNRDAVTICESLRYTSDVVSASVEPVAPGDWKCTEIDHRFTCGFTGKMVCRVRDHIVSDQERCRDDPRSGQERRE